MKVPLVELRSVKTAEARLEVNAGVFPRDGLHGVALEGQLALGRPANAQGPPAMLEGKRGTVGELHRDADLHGRNRSTNRCSPSMNWLVRLKRTLWMRNHVPLRLLPSCIFQVPSVSR